MTTPKPEKPGPAKTDTPRPAYQPPRIITYTSEEILEQVGPALACSSFTCGLG
jgi:hypothetical protein